MSFLISDANLPATLTASPMTDEEFSAFCAEHPDLNFEMTAEGEIIVMAATPSVTSFRNSDVTGQLYVWARKSRNGFLGESSGGFVLPNGARRSPDASWTLRSRLKVGETLNLEGFWHLCHDFVIEIKSSSDRLATLRNKMREYLENGAQLGWLIDPERRLVEIYRTGGEVESHTGTAQITGEGPVAGFVLDLTYVWDPLAD